MEVNEQIKDGAILLFSYIVLLLFAMFIPSAIFIIVVLLPVPIIIFALRYEQRHFLMFIGVTTIVIFLLTVLIGNMIVITPIFVLTLLGGVAIGDALRKRKTPYQTWISGTVGFVIGLLFVFIYTQFVLDVNWAHEIDLQIDQVFKNISSMVNQVDQLGPTDQINDQLETLKEQMGIMKDLIPAGIAISAMIIAFLTQWISYRIISIVDQIKLQFPPIRKLKFPSAILWVYILALLVSIFETNTSSGLFIGAQNVISLTGFLMILQGITFIFFYAHHKNRSNVLPIIAIISLVLLPLLLYIVRLLGLIDMAFSLRERMRKAKEG